ncbi:hypothetical protein DNTS_035653 [Danionella cerebrum]|uniref:WH2 domain-containing protein n=1 Tax=Danionella cerebrum TaxID=2873325 RepID=A0A553QYD3_9TELE|nr:hypothetical protein DNTS_035653 [Danionella translucida]
MPIPPPPPPPGGAPPPPSQSNKLSRDEAKGRGALLSDICKGTRLKKVAVVNDRSAPLIEKPKGSGSTVSSPGSSSPSVQPIGGLFQGGVPKLRPVGDGCAARSALHPLVIRSAAPRPPSGHEDSESTPPRCPSPPESGPNQRPSMPELSRSPASSPSTGMKHSSSAPPPPPPMTRRANAPPAPPQKAPAPLYNREKPLPPTPELQRGPSPAPGVKPPPSPASSRSSSSSSLAPPPPPYRQQSGVSNGPSSPVNEAAPELPQRHNSLSKKPSSVGHTPTRGPAPPPPPSPSPQAARPPPPPSPSPQAARPPPPSRDPPGRGAAPPVPGQPSRNGRDAPPPPPPYRTQDAPIRGKPPPPPSRTPAGPPPPPPPIRNGHTSCPRSFVDDFESKYSFHPLDDFPPPEEYRHFTKIYPSKANRVMRGAPPLPPVGR